MNCAMEHMIPTESNGEQRVRLFISILLLLLLFFLYAWIDGPAICERKFFGSSKHCDENGKPNFGHIFPPQSQSQIASHFLHSLLEFGRARLHTHSSLLSRMDSDGMTQHQLTWIFEMNAENCVYTILRPPHPRPNAWGKSLSIPITFATSNEHRTNIPY